MNRTPILFLNVIVIATCGLIYELVAGTLASYVLGDSVTQFSLVIGIYLFSMGAGAWLSRFVEKDLALRFVEVELARGLRGVLGARMTGGGFGGSTVSLVRREALEEFERALSEGYERETGKRPAILVSEAGAGAAELGGA